MPDPSLIKLDGRLHDARETLRRLRLAGAVDEESINRAQRAITNAMQESKSEAWNGLLFAARADLEQTLQPTVNDKSARVQSAEDKIAVALGDLHRVFDDKCPRVGQAE